MKIAHNYFLKNENTHIDITLHLLIDILPAMKIAHNYFLKNENKYIDITCHLLIDILLIDILHDERARISRAFNSKTCRINCAN